MTPATSVGRKGILPENVGHLAVVVVEVEEAVVAGPQVPKSLVD